MLAADIAATKILIRDLEQALMLHETDKNLGGAKIKHLQGVCLLPGDGDGLAYENFQHNSKAEVDMKPRM